MWSLINFLKRGWLHKFDEIATVSKYCFHCALVQIRLFVLVHYTTPSSYMSYCLWLLPCSFLPSKIVLSIIYNYFIELCPRHQSHSWRLNGVLAVNPFLMSSNFLSHLHNVYCLWLSPCSYVLSRICLLSIIFCQTALWKCVQGTSHTHEDQMVYRLVDLFSSWAVTLVANISYHTVLWPYV